MKKSISIRTKLFIGVTVLVGSFVALSIILNSYFLKPYYILQKKNMLTRNAEYIDSIYKNNITNNLFNFEKMERNNGLHIIITDSGNYMKYNTLNQGGGIKGQDKKAPPDDINIVNQFSNDTLSQEKYIFKIGIDKRLNTNFLYYFRYLNNGDKLLLSIPLQEITASVSISNQFLILIGILTMMIGIIVTLIFSKKFTKPIVNLNIIAQSMSHLNFTEKYKVRGNDELSELGNSLNSLSEQLDKSISELKEKNMKLSEDIEKERELDETRKEFIANVSHELKTPISIIQGYAEGLKSNVNEDEESKNFYCDVIVNESKKMNQLVRSLLNLSLIDSGTPQLDIISFDISELIEVLSNRYKPIFDEKIIKLDLSSVKALNVSGDMLMIEQVLVNYITNAINHIEGKRELIISTNQEKDKIRVSVFNSGKHIPDESMEKVWQSFYKVDKARTRAYGGTGLGLSIVAGIQKLHNNKLGLVNVDSGVSFWFDIDVSKE